MHTMGQQATINPPPQASTPVHTLSVPAAQAVASYVPVLHGAVHAMQHDGVVAHTDIQQHPRPSTLTRYHARVVTQSAENGGEGIDAKNM